MNRSILTSDTVHTPFSVKVNVAVPEVLLALCALCGYIRAVEQKTRTWETACHFSPLVRIVGLIPATNVLAPFIVWVMCKRKSTETDRHGRAVLDFQLTMTLYFLILFVISKVANQWGAIGILEVPACIFLRVWAYIYIYLILRGGFKAAKGDLFKYPFSIRFFSQ